MTKQEKIEGLKDWLTKKNILFVSDKDIEGYLANIVLKEYRIAVSTVEEGADFVYNSFCLAHYRSFFIRENESMDFIIEKMSNCLHSIKEHKLHDLFKHVWKHIGYGKHHRHRPEITEEIVKSQLVQYMENLGPDDAGNEVINDFKDYNVNYFKKRHEDQVNIEKEFRQLKKKYKDKPQLLDKWKAEKYKIKLKYGLVHKRRKRFIVKKGVPV